MGWKQIVPKETRLSVCLQSAKQTDQNIVPISTIRVQTADSLDRNIRKGA